MAAVDGSTRERARRDARAALASATLRASVRARAWQVVLSRGIDTGARIRIASSSEPTRVRGRSADHRIRADADARKARITLRTLRSVVAACAVRFSERNTFACPRVAASSLVALIGCDAGADGTPHTGARCAGGPLPASIAARARRAVSKNGARASAVRRIAGSNGVAVVESLANDGLRSRTNARYACITLCAEIPVRTGDPIADARVGARARRRITRASRMALIESSARDRVASKASPILTCISL